jgi:hypothetical protein
MVVEKQLPRNALELLRLVRGHQLAMRQAREIVRHRVAPDFSVFNFMDPDELRLTEIRAWLLNPMAITAKEIGSFVLSRNTSDRIGRTPRSKQPAFGKKLQQTSWNVRIDGSTF